MAPSMYAPNERARARKCFKLNSVYTRDDLKAAYRREALLHHPDKAGGSSTKKFQELQQFFELLSIDAKSQAEVLTEPKESTSTEKARAAEAALNLRKANAAAAAKAKARTAACEDDDDSGDDPSFKRAEDFYDLQADAPATYGPKHWGDYEGLGYEAGRQAPRVVPARSGPTKPNVYATCQSSAQTRAGAVPSSDVILSKPSRTGQVSIPQRSIAGCYVPRQIVPLSDYIKAEGEDGLKTVQKMMSDKSYLRSSAPNEVRKAHRKEWRKMLETDPSKLPANQPDRYGKWERKCRKELKLRAQDRAAKQRAAQRGRRTAGPG